MWSAERRGKPRHGLRARRGDGDCDFGGLVLDGVEPVRVGACVLEQPVARAQGAFEGGDPARVLRIDGEHQAVEKAPPLRGRAVEQRVHRRRQPDNAQVIGEGGGGGDLLAVDPAFARGRGVFARRGINARAERGKPQHALDLPRHRPGAVAFGKRHFLHGGAAQAPARREQRHRLDQIGLAGAVGAREHHRAGFIGERKACRVIAAEIRQRQTEDVRSGHRRALAPAPAELKPASASAHRARPWRPCPGSASASRGRRA